MADKFNSAILYQSLCNHWMQAIIYLDDVDFNVLIAVQAIRSGIDKMWNEEYECYGEAIEAELDKNNILYDVEYCKYNPEDDNPLEEWDEHILELEKERKIKYYMS